MGKQTKAQKMKARIKERKEKKEFEKDLLMDMSKNMGKSNYMRGMGLMLRQIAPPPRPQKIKLTPKEKERMKAGERLAR